MNFFFNFATIVSLLTASSLVFAPNVNSATLITHPAAITTHPVLKRITVVLTAYVPNPGSLTSTGKDANTGPGIAADFSVFPRGTRILLPNKGIFTVDDTGGFRLTDPKKGIRRHIDLRIIPSYRPGTDPRIAFQEAVSRADKVGRRTISVYILLYSNGSSHTG